MEASVERGEAVIEDKLAVLGDKQRRHRRRIEDRRAQMKALLDRNGTSNLEGLYEFGLRRVGLIQDEATTVNLHRIHVESRLTVLDRHKESKPDAFEQTQVELAIAKEYAQRVDKELARGKETLRSLGRAQLDLEDLDYDLEINRELYGLLRRQIAVLESERQSSGSER